MKEILEVLRGTESSRDLVLLSFISLMSYNKICLISHETLRYPRAIKVSYVRQETFHSRLCLGYGTGGDRESKG